MAEVLFQWQIAGQPREGSVTGDAPAAIGREAGSDVYVESANHAVSRRHAQVRRRSDGFAISDLTNGRNPVFVNERTISTETILREGDSIRLGDVTLRVATIRGIKPPSDGPTMRIRWDHRGHTHEETIFGGDPVIIGRLSPATILIPDDTVSRQHAQISEKGNRFVITDLTAGRNPITINQRPLSGERYLSPGDVITLGAVTVVITSVRSAGPQPGAITELTKGRLVNCPTCHREVDGSLQDCPWCGTALVNAVTILPGL